MSALNWRHFVGVHLMLHLSYLKEKNIMVRLLIFGYVNMLLLLLLVTYICILLLVPMQYRLIFSPDVRTQIVTNLIWFLLSFILPLQSPKKAFLKFFLATCNAWIVFLYYPLDVDFENKYFSVIYVQVCYHFDKIIECVE